MPTPLAILFESDTLVAVDKPAGIIVHGDGTDRLAATLAARGGEVATRIDELQALQRLDRETSGIVLFSTSKATQGAYDRAIAEHRFEKRYLAIVEGKPNWREHTFTGPIGRDRHDARRMRVSRTGKPATTHARVLATRTLRGRALTLLDVRIETGRKHQIRVHLSHAGLPLMGDALYGRSDSAGLMLHAAHLAFTDPVSGEHVSIDAPAPVRMRALFGRELGPA